MSLKNLKCFFLYGKVPRCQRPKEWKIKTTDKILILTPHPDDETIACGGLLYKYGPQCDVILLTDGSHGNPNIEPREMSKIRYAEFSDVMTELGVKSFSSLNIEDGKLIYNDKIFKTINFSGYKYILIPHKRDSHPDHYAVFILINKFFKNIKNKLVFYELWTPMLHPTHYIDISDVIDKKTDLINKYKSQVSLIDYAQKMRGLNCYRGLVSETNFAEMYYIKN
jgi:LmbE family N-acetylglucosaminyl deacetylase